MSDAAAESRKTLALVPDQAPLVRAALILADFAIELRNRGQALDEIERERVERELRDVAPISRSRTMIMRLQKSYDEMLIEFDQLADDYAKARLEAMKASAS